MKLSVVIITKNEQQNISRCLNSVKGVADDIVVVDSMSTDCTPEICKTFGTRFFSHEWEGYAKQKNFANGMALYDWIFSIDADEALTPQLEQEIINLKRQDIPNNTVYFVKRLTNYCGNWIKHCGWYPDKQLRLWNRTIGQWDGIVHEKPTFNGQVQYKVLRNDLFHYSFHSMNQHLQKEETYARLKAQKMFQQGKCTNGFQLWILPKWRFFERYILRLGFLDGHYGYVVCKIAAWGVVIKLLSLEDLKKQQ